MGILQLVIYGRGWSIDDAAGKRVPLYDQFRRGLWKTTEGEVSAGEFRKVQSRIRRQGLVPEPLGCMLIFGSVALFGLSSHLIRLPIHVWVAICSSIGAVSYALSRRFGIGADPNAFAAAMLDIHRCPPVDSCCRRA